MILSNQQMEKLSIKEISNHKHMVLNIEHLNYTEDIQLFGYAIETLNLINTINWANKLYENAESKIRIETGILYKAIDALLNQRSFTDEELLEYFKVLRKTESLYKTLLKFKEVETYIPYEAEFILLGMKFETLQRLDKHEIENIHEEYGNNYCDAIFRDMALDDFITRAKGIIKNCKEKKLVKCA